MDRYLPLFQLICPFTPEDTKLMAQSEVDDYYKFFKSEKSDSLHKYVRVCLRFEGVEGTNEEYRLITTRAKEALKRIASENRLNRMRVSTIYKIEIDPPIDQHD